MMPATDARPALRPWSMLRLTTYRTAGPGIASSASAVATKIAYVDAEGIGLVTVHRRDLATRRSDPFAQLGRLEHLDLRPEPEELAIGVAEVGERDDRAAVLVHARLARQPAADVVVDPHRHLHARKRGFEGARPLLPEGSELERGWPLEAVRERAHRCDARDAVDAHPGRAAGDEVPGAALQHEA